MKNRSWLAFAILIAALVSPLALRADDQIRIVLISIDGLMASSYTKPGPAKIPVLRSLARDGAYAEGVVGVLPSVTYPSHTSLITGVPPAVHGILDNRFMDPEDRSDGGWYWYAQDIRVATLVGAARSRGLQTAAITWPVTVGMEADFLVPEFWRSDHLSDLSMLRALSTPHLLDAVEINRKQPFGWRQNDRERTDIAKFILRTYKPHLMLLHIIELDGAQHRYGPGSADALTTLERIDGYIGEIRQTLVETGIADRTYLAITSDHGFLPTQQQLQPNFAFKEAGLITTDPRGRISDWRAYFHASGGAGFVYLKDPSDLALREQVGALLAKLHATPQNGIASVWSQKDLERWGTHPDAAFGIGMRPQFYLGGGLDALLKDTGSKGGHGFDPTIPDMHSSLILSGPGMKGQGNLGIVRMTQIAPTLARLLNVSLSPQADQPIKALLKIPDIR
ncbi:MAG: alkaline phosphatase family protein [Acidobacteria bacterium]|nr:alkaline phosphatase family protein [Acidobacteriota bacterium]